MDALHYIYPVRCAQAYSATIVCVSVEVDERQRGIIIYSDDSERSKCPGAY